MSNIEFLTVPLGAYIQNHLKFGEDVDKEPKVFATNYFLKENGGFLNSKLDKKVWLLWIEGRVHDEYGAIETPVGFIPKYSDLKELFRKVFDKDYTKTDYKKQFSIRILRLLERLDRIESAYKAEENIPKIFHRHIKQERERLKEAQKKFGKDIISPFEFE